jgi:chitin-binding protein
MINRRRSVWIQGELPPERRRARFPELNDDALFADRFFTVPSGVQEIGFTWTLTAPRRTTTWDYIAITADNTLLTSFDSHNTIPPSVVEHIVPLGGLTGRHTILGRWNIGDTPNAFYSAVDLLIESS